MLEGFGGDTAYERTIGSLGGRREFGLVTGTYSVSDGNGGARTIIGHLDLAGRVSCKCLNNPSPEFLL